VYWLGLILFALGAFLLGFSNPWKFFEAIEGSFFDWTEAFWYLQWGGFWLVSGSVFVFGCLAKTPAAFAARWRLIPPGIAVVMFALFFAYSMPEKSNQRDWKNGWLGARVYIRTKVWLRGDNRDESGLPDRLAGRWESPGGFSFAISRDAIRMISPAGETEWSARTCRRFEMDYDFAFRSNLERPMPAGLALTPFDQKGAASAMSLPDRRFPRVSCSCDSEFATWVLVDIDRLMAFVDTKPILLARR